MENQELKEIFNRYLENRCSVKEAQQLFHYFQTDENIYFLQLINEELEKAESYADDQNLQHVAQEVFLQIKQQLNILKTNRLKYFLINHWEKLSTAAILLIVSAITFYFFSVNQQAKEFQLPVKYANDLVPGQNKALLTLADGKKIMLLDKGEVFFDKILKGININKADDGQLIYALSKAGETEKSMLNTLETPKGGQYQLHLADGTKVWMNSDSKLIYPTAFKVSGTRTVELSGEAYFEVAHHKNQPFIVNTNQQQIEVLGTHFNVKAYTNELAQETTLLDGSIKVSVLNKSKILKPGQQATTLKHATNIKVIPFVDTGMVIAWKEGLFFFDNTEIEKVMQQACRWYNAEVVYEGKKPNVSFTGVVLKSKNLSDLLEILQAAGEVKFNIIGNKIIVKNKN